MNQSTIYQIQYKIYANGNWITNNPEVYENENEVIKAMQQFINIDISFGRKYQYRIIKTSEFNKTLVTKMNNSNSNKMISF